METAALFLFTGIRRLPFCTVLLLSLMIGRFTPLRRGEVFLSESHVQRIKMPKKVLPEAATTVAGAEETYRSCYQGSVLPKDFRHRKIVFEENVSLGNKQSKQR